jgi:protein gp37
MSIISKIEWTNSSWNPFRGCTKISPGCLNCYAHTFAERWRGIPGHAYELGFDPRPVPERLGDPLRWAKPRTIFVNSMSDLFHEKATDDYIAQVGEVMLAADWHTFQVLTKRPERMVRLLKGPLKGAAKAKHILWGATVETRPARAGRRWRIPHSRSRASATMLVSTNPTIPRGRRPRTLQHWIRKPTDSAGMNTALKPVHSNSWTPGVYAAAALPKS